MLFTESPDDFAMVTMVIVFAGPAFHNVWPRNRQTCVTKSSSMRNSADSAAYAHKLVQDTAVNVEELKFFAGRKASRCAISIWSSATSTMRKNVPGG